MEPQENPYEILGVDQDADEDTIKKAFRKAALRYHPDRQHSEEDKQSANDIFAKYSAAYDIITDPVKRYDWKQAQASKTSKRNDPPPTPTTVKKPVYCPQSAPARTSTAYSWKPPSSSSSKKKTPPPPPPFGGDKNNATNTPKQGTSTSYSWKPPPSKKPAPPPPPFSDDEPKERTKTLKTRDSSYRFTNQGSEKLERSHRRVSSYSPGSVQDQPSGSYAFVPQNLNSRRHLTEDLRPRMPSSRIFSEQPKTQDNSIPSSPRRSSSHRPSFLNQQPDQEVHGVKNTMEATRGRSHSPRRQKSSRKLSQPKKVQHNNHDHHHHHSRSQSPRERRPCVESSSSPRHRRKSASVSRERGSLPPPTKGRSIWGIVSNSPKARKFIHELTRDTRVDAEPFRRKKPALDDQEDCSNNTAEKIEKSTHSRRDSFRRSKSLTGRTTTNGSTASRLSFFRPSSSKATAEQKVDTTYSYSAPEDMEHINDSAKPRRRGKRPPRE